MSAPPASSRVLTLVFTDLVGSTALKSERGDEAGGALIARHRDLLAGIAREHGGRVVGFAGDGVLLVFDAPSAGALFALALQAPHASETEPSRAGARRDTANSATARRRSAEEPNAMRIRAGRVVGDCGTFPPLEDSR